MKFYARCFAMLAVLMLASVARSDPKESKHETGASSPSFETLKGLAGVWENDAPGPDGKKGIVEFKLTSGGSVVMETMMPGSKYEMLNTYHMDGDKLVMTHYCAQGVQPRMKLARGDAQQMQFDFVDCSNLKDGEGCMGGLEIQTEGNKLAEKWYYRTDGKLGDATTFTYHRKG